MNDRISQALNAFKAPDEHLREVHCPVGSRSLVQRKKEAMKLKEKRKARKLIKPENVDKLLSDFDPESVGELHCITPGDFVMCDLLVRLIQRFGVPSSAMFSTLSMSKKNVESLSELIGQNPFPFTLILSHYFQNTNGDIFTAIETQLIKKHSESVTVKIYRSHAKVFLFDYGDLKIAIESSANLRSSNNIEQFTIFTDESVYEFHSDWMNNVKSLDGDD